MLNTVLFCLIFIILALVVFFVIFAYGSYFFGAPYVPSTYKPIQKMLEVADVKDGSIFFDLGSGDGRVLIAAASKGALCVGYEINPIWFFVSKLRIRLQNLQGKITVKFEDLEKAPFKEADVIYIYLFPEKIAEMEELLKKEIKKNAVVITYKIPFPNWKEKIRLEKEQLFFYVK